jgi:hypothetical protein
VGEALMARKTITTHQPWHPYTWEPADAYALQALAKGIANEGQQKRAIDWIIRSAGTYDATFYVGQHDASDFAQGSRHVGLQIVKLLNLPATVIEKAK